MEVTSAPSPRTLLEAVTYFADVNRAHGFAVKWRWPNGIACPRKGCGSASVTYISTRRTWRCKHCKRQFTAKVGTIFEDSPIPVNKWLPAMWFLANTNNGTSSQELGRALGVTQYTAWFMLHRIRLTMEDTAAAPPAGVVEADETFVGGKAHATHITPLGFRKSEHGPARGKATVFGMIERFESVLKNADGRRVTYAALTSGHLVWRLKPGRAKHSPLYHG